MSVATEINDSEIREMEPEAAKDASIPAQPNRKDIDAESAAEKSC